MKSCTVKSIWITVFYFFSLFPIGFSQQTEVLEDDQRYVIARISSDFDQVILIKEGHSAIDRVRKGSIANLDSKIIDHWKENRNENYRFEYLNMTDTRVKDMMSSSELEVFDLKIGHIISLSKNTYLVTEVRVFNYQKPPKVIAIRHFNKKDEFTRFALIKSDTSSVTEVIGVVNSKLPMEYIAINHWEIENMKDVWGVIEIKSKKTRDVVSRATVAHRAVVKYGPERDDYSYHLKPNSRVKINNWLRLKGESLPFLVIQE